MGILYFCWLTSRESIFDNCTRFKISTHKCIIFTVDSAVYNNTQNFAASQLNSICLNKRALPPITPPTLTNSPPVLAVVPKLFSDIQYRQSMSQYKASTAEARKPIVANCVCVNVFFSRPTAEYNSVIEMTKQVFD